MLQAASEATPLHRGRFDIMVTILLSANETAARKTRIMHKCNLSFRQLRTYLKLLAETGLLRPTVEDTGTDENPVCFKTTQKGKAFIRAYRNLKALLTETPNSTLAANTWQSGFRLRALEREPSPHQSRWT